MAVFSYRTGLSDPPPAPLSLRSAAIGMAVFYLTALLLNASSMQREIDLVKYGKRHDVGMVLIEPVAALSHALRLDRPRQWLEQSIGAWLQNAKMGL